MDTIKPTTPDAERTAGSLHRDCSTAPVILCKIIGHKWRVKTHRDDEPEKGYRTTTTHEKKACIRCGTPNPNYEAQ